MSDSERLQQIIKKWDVNSIEIPDQFMEIINKNPLLLSKCFAVLQKKFNTESTRKGWKLFYKQFFTHRKFQISILEDLNENHTWREYEIVSTLAEGVIGLDNPDREYIKSFALNQTGYYSGGKRGIWHYSRKVIALWLVDPEQNSEPDPELIRIFANDDPQLRKIIGEWAENIKFPSEAYIDALEETSDRKLREIKDRWISQLSPYSGHRRITDRENRHL